MNFPEPSSAQQTLESTTKNRHRLATEMHEKADQALAASDSLAPAAIAAE
jgi:hypothetical protein